MGQGIVPAGMTITATIKAKNKALCVSSSLRLFIPTVLGRVITHLPR